MLGGERMVEVPEEKSLKEQVVEFFQKPILAKSALERLFMEDLTEILEELVNENVLNRKVLFGVSYYTLSAQ